MVAPRDGNPELFGFVALSFGDALRVAEVRLPARYEAEEVVAAVRHEEAVVDRERIGKFGLRRGGEAAEADGRQEACVTHGSYSSCGG